MRSELIDCGWTEEHWNRIVGVVTDEVQKARVAAQILPTFGPQDESAVSFSDFRLDAVPNTMPVPPNPPQRLTTRDMPDHPLTSIAVPVQLTSADMAAPDMQGALTKFRRAANIVARPEDAVVFNDRILDGRPTAGVAGIPQVDLVSGGGPYGGANVELGLCPLDLGGGPGGVQVRPIPPRGQVSITTTVPGLAFPAVPTDIQ